MQLPFGKKDVGNAKTDNTDEKGKSSKLARRSIEKAKEPTGIFGAPAVIMGPRLMFIAAVVILCLLGLIMIYSASSITAYASSDFNNDPTYFFKKQLMWLAIGTVACVAATLIPHRIWANRVVSLVLWGVTLLLLIAVVSGLGTTSLGADRALSFGGISIQPSEFAKISVLLVMAGILERYSQNEISADLAGIELLVISLVTLALIYKQPDLGSAIILIVGILALFILAGVSWKIIFIIIGIGVVYAAYALITQPYHMERIMTMFDPWADAQGDGYQSVQGFLAFGSGGIFGTGLGMSRQKYLYLPYAYNDFIYAVIGEELGLIGALFVLLVFMVLVFAGLRISRTAPDLFGSAISGAMTTMIGFQACVNMACVAGVAPVTGKALPFISYGGSSLLATMIMAGLVLSVSLRSRVDNQSEMRRENLMVMDGGRSKNAQQGSAAAAPTSIGSIVGGLAGGVAQRVADSRQQKMNSYNQQSSRGQGSRRSQRQHDDYQQSRGRTSRRNDDMDLDLVDIQPRLGRPDRNARPVRSSRGSSRPSGSHRTQPSSKRRVNYSGSEPRGGSSSRNNDRRR